MGILHIAEMNAEIRLLLGIIIVAFTFLPFLHNLEGLIEDFAPEKSHRMISLVFGTVYYFAMAVALLSAGYIWITMKGTTGILTLVP